jgi:hypothetical protein
MNETDRQKLERLSQEREATRIAEDQNRQAQNEAHRQREAARDNQDIDKTKEVITYFRETFKGFKLVPTGHEVGIDTTPTARMFPNAKPDGVEYAMLHISHWGDETGNFQGQIPILLGRHRHGKVCLQAVGEYPKCFDTFDEFKDAAVEAVASIGRDSIMRIFEAVRSAR